MTRRERVHGNLSTYLVVYRKDVNFHHVYDTFWIPATTTILDRKSLLSIDDCLLIPFKMSWTITAAKGRFDMRANASATLTWPYPYGRLDSIDVKSRFPCSNILHSTLVIVTLPTVFSCKRRRGGRPALAFAPCHSNFGSVRSNALNLCHLWRSRTVPFPQTKNTINLVFLTVLHSVALLSTIFRIVQRWSASRLWWDDFLLFLPLGLDATYLATLWVLYHRSCQYFPAFYCYTNRFFYTVAPDEKVIDSFWFTTLLWFLIIWCENNFHLSQQSDAGPQDMSHQPGLINGQNISSWPPLSTIVFDPCILSCCYVYCVYRHSFSHLPCGEQAHVPRRILHKGCSDGYILCVVLHLKF